MLTDRTNHLWPTSSPPPQPPPQPPQPAEKQEEDEAIAREEEEEAEALEERPSKKRTLRSNTPAAKGRLLALCMVYAADSPGKDFGQGTD